MDITWVTEQIALGGGIWNERNMEELTQSGVTHVVDMQIEFDDRPLAEPHGIEVLWNPTDDDFLPKPAELFERGVEFALAALANPEARLYVHCAARSAPGPNDDTGDPMRHGVEDRRCDGID